MRSRLLVFVRTQTPSGNRILFAIKNDSLTHAHEFSSIGELAQALGLTRREDFDWAVGDAGARCALLELPLPAPKEESPLPSSLGPVGPLEWLDFRQAARRLSDGDDRRYLQLAVQYISQGGVDDSVVAADYDMDFLNTLRKEIERQTDREEDRT